MWKMDPNELLLTRGGVGGNTNGNTGEGFIDRSKVRILLCDNDTKSSEEVFHLLCKCSYQVTSARSPRQVIDALNAEGPDIDIILSEVDLPMAKGFKMLKYIMRDKDLRRIPIIMMSAQDEVALVVKCLRLGAADYLVKPLRTNELLNLWTHMWRRRRMLGLAEKNIMNCEFDLVQSDPSDANTNSTTLFSDDTDEKSKKTSNPEISVSFPREDETNVITTPTQLVNRPNVPEINEQQRGKIMFGPKKSELKIGQSSAFFTYVKTNMSLGRSPTPPFLPETSDPVKIPDLPEPEPQIQETDNYNNNNNNNYHPDVSGYNAYSPYPYYHYNHVMQCPPGMGSFPYYPVNYCLPGAVNQWPPASSAVHKIDRREAALIKFRQKRKERCFDKKIRYVNRKKLAERRPRVRGQFVRKINGINVDLNGQPSCTDFDDEDDDVEDEDDQDQDQDPAGSDDNYPVFHG